eukprot:GFUD01003340.1.p1 GENE.GFUD01003340.1~~GFUD01003340.1.p1  ORF type:complete len:246 (-),score=55.82 GFUD01003340.1:222-959(-)
MICQHEENTGINEIICQVKEDTGKNEEENSRKNKIICQEKKDAGRNEIICQEKFKNSQAMSFDSRIDEADRCSVFADDLVVKHQQNPHMIPTICKEETHETIIHILAREGKLKMMKDICDEEKTRSKKDLKENLLCTLKIKDNFEQTPLLASFRVHNQEETKETTQEYLLKKIVEYDDDILERETIGQMNKTNDSVLTELFRNRDIHAEAIKIYFEIFARYNEKKRSHSKGFYDLVLQILRDNVP